MTSKIPPVSSTSLLNGPFLELSLMIMTIVTITILIGVLVLWIAVVEFKQA